MNLKIAAIDMEILSKNASGPLGWIKDGTLDVDLQVFLPAEAPTNQHPEYYHPIHEHQHAVHDANSEYDAANSASTDKDNMSLIFNTHINYINLSPPIYSSEISWLNNALIHPIASYLNSHSKHIPLTFSFDAKKVSVYVRDSEWYLNFE